MPTAAFETKLLSSLAKVFPDQEPADPPYRKASALSNETFAFQIAYKTMAGGAIKNVRIGVSSPLSSPVSVRVVGLVPSELPIYPNHDGHLLRSEPGLFPDPLFPVNEAGVAVPPQQWRSVWVTVMLDGADPAGVYPIRVVFEDPNGEELAVETFELDVLPARLPEQRLLHTEWFHADCLAVHYGVEPLSEPHWRLIEQYAATAASHGMNMLLTPLFTPPLDTKIGGERPTVQLVDVCLDGERYGFGFERLKRWVDMCSRIGIRYLEFSHLFTQWGAKHAPKIMATVDGEYRQLFGWETDATGDEYKGFLDALLPELVGFIHANGLESSVYFHVSDEPHLDHFPFYSSASDTLKRHIGDFPVIDALSNFEFYEQGLVKRPIPASNHIEPFLSAGVPDLWTYYCCSQYKDVSNRFFAMPSARNRIIAMQLYKYRIAGFLHWGYNFWFSQFSIRPIDPYRVTDADFAFPSGDAFLVYPGEEGPVESIRLEVFNEALQDLRAFELLESLIGRDAVLQLLEDGLEEAITFSAFPKEADWLLARRETINRAIREALQNKQ